MDTEHFLHEATGTARERLSSQEVHQVYSSKEACPTLHILVIHNAT